MNPIQSAIQNARTLHQAGGGSVLDILLRAQNFPKAELEATLEALGVAVITSTDQAQLDWGSLPPDQCQTLNCVPVKIIGKEGRFLAVADPWRPDWQAKAMRLLGETPQFAATTQQCLNIWLRTEQQTDHQPSRASTAPPLHLTALTSPVVAFVDNALQASFTEGASDIHFECGRQGVSVKFRQDGVMVPFASMEDPKKAEEVISRIKVLSQLDITERRIPQDGRFRFETSAGSVDLRVSIMPSVFGEDAVLRLLDKAQLRSHSDNKQARVSLDILGFDAANAQRIRDLAELPHGLLLVTGPTGSGKTTTVYAVLSEINTGIEKIITIEDPVEYELPGVLQIPVNERKGLTFAKGLRSILRHDPDRILVGEIRDGETAEIAVQSALTGHQVFTTVHANSIFDVTGRFRHFDLDMFGFMSALNGVIVQRLVRRVCSHCRGERQPTEKELQWLATHHLTCETVSHPKGCDKCHQTGYHGRFVIAEVHTIDDIFRDLVTGLQPVSALREHVRASGIATLGLQAAHHVINGITTPQEIKRVVGWL